jgi:uncharacterized protein with GYD domain
LLNSTRGWKFVPTYITLINWTDRGAGNAKDTVQRYEAAEGAALKMGVKFKSFHWTMGAYDAVGIVEAPDDAAVSRFLLATGAQGSVRTATMRAYAKDEMTQILEGLP